MQLLDKAKASLKNALIGRLSNVDIAMAARQRFGKASEGIVPLYAPERRVTLNDWQNAVDRASNPLTLNRWLYYRASENAMMDLHLTSIIDTRHLKLQTAKFKLIDPSGKEDHKAKEMLQAQWYSDYLKHAFDSIFEGYSLIELFDLADDIKTVELNSSKKNFRPIKEATLIKRAHVRPEKGKFIINTFDDLNSGIDYTMPPVSNYYIGVGAKDNLGLMKKIIPIALAKRYALGAWGDFDEKLGIPFRYVTMQGTDKRREKLLAEIMENMGPAGWGIFHEGETIQLLQNASADVHKCFLELINLCDKQMSKAVLGSTMTVDAEGGQYKGDVHQDTSEIRFEADKTFIEYLNNDKLIPRLIMHGYPLQGYRYERDNTQELSLKDQITIDTVLLQHYKIAPEHIAEKYDIPLEMIEGKSAENIQDVLSENVKKKAPVRNSNFHIGGFEASIINACEKLYFSGCAHNHSIQNKKFSYNDIERVIKDVFNKTLKAGDLDEGLFDWQVKQLVNGLQEGYGKEFISINYNVKDGEKINKLKEGIFLFSAAKNYQELRAMSDMLLDADGNIKTYKEFKNDVFAVHEKYDQRFLAAEYGNAVVSADMAAYWDKIQSEKHILPYLIYNSILDGSTTNLCRDLDGTKKHVDDPIWITCYPPNHFGERATVDQTSDASSSDKEVSIPELKPIFKNNVGITGVVFPESHPYYQASRAQKVKNAKFAKDKFNPDGE
jgi:hypothetical protein